MDLVEIGLKFTYILLAIGTLAAIVMPLFQALTSDPKSLVKALIGVAAILLVYFVGFAISSNEVTSSYIEFGVDAGLSKMVGGLLIAMYILMALALVGILFTELIKIVR